MREFMAESALVGHHGNQARQNGDDGHHHQQLDQRKALTNAKTAGGLRTLLLVAVRIFFMFDSSDGARAPRVGL